MLFNQKLTVRHTDSPAAVEWQKVKDTASRLCLFQIHSRETLTKSISLPRSAYWQHITRQNSVGDLYSFQGTGMELAIIMRAVATQRPRQRMEASRGRDGEAGDFSIFFLFSLFPTIFSFVKKQPVWHHHLFGS